MASIRSVGKLETGLDDFLGRPIGVAGRATLEARLLVVEHVLEVVVPDPVEADAPWRW